MGILRSRRPIVEVAEMLADVADEMRGKPGVVRKAGRMLLVSVGGLAGLVAASARISAHRHDGAPTRNR